MQPPSQDPSHPTGPPYQPSPYPQPEPPLSLSSSQGNYPPGEEAYYNQISQDGGPITQYRAGTQGKLNAPSKPRNVWKAATLVLLILVLILAIATTTLVLTRPSNSTPLVAEPTSVATQAGQQTTSVPTSASTPSSTVTAQPSATVAAGTITENITLTCGGCNDPIHVTLATIQIDTANGRMIWDNALKDVTGNFSDYDFSEYNLQASDSQTPIQAVLSKPQQSGSNQYDVQAIFAFVPIQHVTYTLFAVVVTVNPSDDVVSGTTTFDPVKITF